MTVNVIDAYRFGQIVVNGKRYTSDVIVFPDKVRSDWYRKSSHQLCLNDIADAVAEKPDVLVIGTGASGLVMILPEVKDSVASQGITFIVQSTGEACQTYNQLCHSQQVVAALHLTC